MNLISILAILNLLLLWVSCWRLQQVLKDNTYDLSEEYITGYFKYATTIIPHPDKIEKGGEDALVARMDLLSVADGVGGWQRHGIDPGLYSKQLVKNIAELHDFNNSLSPKELLVKSAEMATNIGSSTWVIVVLNPSNHTLSTTLLGDSSYMILRPTSNKEIIELYRSEEQQHSFNFPYQWGTNGDNPIVAIDKEHIIQHNDIVILGSDGVFDNWFDHEIIDIVRSNLDHQGNLFDLQEISNSITHLAENHGTDENWRSPFQIHAEKKVKDFEILKVVSKMISL